MGMIGAAPPSKVEVAQGGAVERSNACATTSPPKGGKGGWSGISGAEEGGAAGTLLAVDIGATGACALLDLTGELLAVEDLPVLRDGPNARPTINAVLLAGITARWAPARAAVEYVSARPGEGPAGAFAFGRSRGVIEGVLGAQAIPVRFVTAPWWKRRVGIPPGKDGAKDAARSAAIARWPAQAERFARVKDHGRAEAALIGLAVIQEQAKA